MQGFHLLATWYNPRVSTRLLFARRITLLLYLVWNTNMYLYLQLSFFFFETTRNHPCLFSVECLIQC